MTKQAPKSEHNLQLLVYQKRKFAPFLFQVYIFFKRALIQYWRAVTTVISDIFFVALAGIIVGLMYRNYDLVKVNQVDFVVSLAVGYPVVQSLRIFGAERTVFWRESSAGMNRFAYFLGKNLAVIPFMIVIPAVFMVFFHTLSSPRGSFSLYFAALVAAYYATCGMGQLISTLVSPNKALVAAVIITLVLNDASGSITPTLSDLDKTKIGPAMYTLSYARWLCEALFITEVDSYPEIYDTQKQLLLTEFSYHSDNYALDLGMMFVLGVTFQILAFIGLVSLNRSKQK